MSWTPPENGKTWTPPGKVADPEPHTTDLPPWERSGKVWEAPGKTEEPKQNPMPWERGGKVWDPKTAKVSHETQELRKEQSDPQGGLVKAWSASALDKFDNCPYAVFLNKVKKIPEESSAAADRGTEIHSLAEQYIEGTLGDLPEELERYAGGFKRLREGFAEGKVIVEQDWGFDVKWAITGWTAPDIWGRMKLDAFEREDETSAKVIDFKTGRKFGNEVKHNRQAMIYAVGAFMRFPELEFITTEFWYLDQNDAPLVNHYTRRNLKILRPRIEERAIRMTSCQDFRPKPGRDSCRWCTYKKTGDCEWRYEE